MFFLRKSITCPLLYQEIPLSTPLDELKFVVFDTETTGFEIATSDRLIEIGAVLIEGFKVCEASSFQTYVNPSRQISREITELTSISNEQVAGAPYAFEAISDFFSYVREQETVSLVGHYVSFDTLVLKNELKREKIGLKGTFTIDTLDLIGFLAPSYDMRDLERYARAFGTRIYERHNAVGDAKTTAYLFVELIQQFHDRGYCTWGELVKATESQARFLQL
jgi:DNA polymerase III subunit epsilon